jgi:hypothetical protein
MIVPARHGPYLFVVSLDDLGYLSTVCGCIPQPCRENEGRAAHQNCVRNLLVSRVYGVLIYEMAF